MHYESLFTWEGFHNEHVIRHQDGSLSAAIEWGGVDASINSINGVSKLFSGVKSQVNSISSDIVIEQHMLRDYGDDLIEQYLKVSDEKTVRNHEVATFVKEDIAQHYIGHAMTNRCVLVLTLKKTSSSLFEIFSAKRYLGNVDKQAETLHKAVKSAVAHFQGKLLNKKDWNEFVCQSIYPKLFYPEPQTNINENYFLYEQWIKEKPQLVDGCLKIGKHYVKTALLYLYPDADLQNINIGFSRRLSVLNGYQTRITHVLQRINKNDAKSRSEKRSKNTRSFSSQKNVEGDSAKLTDESRFRHEIVNEGAEVYRNAYIITLAYDDPDLLNERMEKIRGDIQSNQGELRYSDSSQLVYFRYSLPAQGYNVPWMREDIDSQVANLFPCQKFRQGNTDLPYMLRQTHTGELVAKGYRNDQVNHSITAAATGAGKGVQKCAEILETYPLGIDWYIAEIGTSYQWTVEACGGTYLEIDPETTCINPLPPLSSAQNDNENIFDSKVIIGTVEGLAFLLVDGDRELTYHESAAAQKALKSLYLNITEQTKQPRLCDLVIALKQSELFGSDERIEAAKTMAANLDSFLETEQGRVFNQDTNLHLHEGIFAVNLKKVHDSSSGLLKFYFVFIGLAYMQFAYAAGKPSRVLLDEMHVLVKEAPVIASKLISGVARMGRKEGAAIDLVTQETEEIEAVEEAVINQTPYFNLLWRQAGWEKISQRLSMPNPVLEHWKNWKDPVSTSLPYRNCLSLIGGEYYELKLSFSKTMLAIASSSETDLVAKPFVGNLTKDLKTRIQLLFKYRDVYQRTNSHEQAQLETETYFSKEAA